MSPIGPISPIKPFTEGVAGIINLFPSELGSLSPDLTCSNFFASTTAQLHSCTTKQTINYSIGVHPCFISEDNLESDLSRIREYAKKKNVLAIGEIGLDKYSKVDVDLQKKVFEEQLSIAEDFCKPVIIHCVGYFSEMLSLKKNSTIPWIIHGFRGKPELASQLVNKGFFLSFGCHVLNPSPTLLETLTAVPCDKLFLETDDSGADIKQIYQKVAEIKNIPLEHLIEIINNNTRLFFTTNLH